MTKEKMKNLFLRLFFPEILNEIEGLQRMEYVKRGRDCRLISCTVSSEPYLVSIGDHVSATKCHFETHDGGGWIFRNENPDIDIIKSITVGNNVYIGINTIIMPGVHIGDNVIVGAGAIVTKDLPSNGVYAGIPARLIKSIDEYRTGIQASIHLTKSMSPKEKEEYYKKEFGLS